MQRTRELISGPLTLDYFMRKAAQGWTLAAVEWVRPALESDPLAPASGVLPVSAAALEQEVPYGLQLTHESARLEPNPLEQTVLLLILDSIVKEYRITEIARQLNEKGLTTRRGTSWSPTDVFDLLPRLIESGPALLRSQSWREIRSSAASRSI